MFAALVVLALLPQPQAAAPPQIDVAKARRVFETSCAGCHGPEGQGGKGPPLAVPKLRRAATDAELAQIILNGIPGTQMPPSWYLGESGVTLAATYVRILGARATPAKIEGNVAQGKALYEGKGGCIGCHTIGAQGHAYGPDLSNIGIRRSAANLRESLSDPSAEIAEGFVHVTAVGRQGTKVSGIRVNEDSFTLQVLDKAGRFHSFRKSDLASIDRDAHKSAMPSYKAVFSESELEDLVAYLSSLRGE